MYNIHITQKVNDPINKWSNNRSQKDEMAKKHIKYTISLIRHQKNAN